MPASLGPVQSGAGGSSSHDGTLSPDADGLLKRSLIEAGDRDSSAKTAVKAAASSLLSAAHWMLSSANPGLEMYTLKSNPVIGIFF